MEPSTGRLQWSSIGAGVKKFNSECRPKKRNLKNPEAVADRAAEDTLLFDLFSFFLLLFRFSLLLHLYRTIGYFKVSIYMLTDTNRASGAVVRCCWFCLMPFA